MAVFKYQRSKMSKKTKERIYKDYYYYEGSYVHPITHEKVRYKKRGFLTQKAAKEAEIEFLNGVKNEPVIDMTIDEVFQLYIKDRTNVIKQRSISDFNYVYNRMVKEYWKNVKISEITIPKITKWQTYLLESKYKRPLKINGKVQYDSNGETIYCEKNYSNEYLKTVQNLLKQLLNFCVTIGISLPISVLKFKIETNKKEIKKDIDFWEPKEFDKFISVVDEPMYHALFNVLYWCGLRIGEALALNIEDVSIVDQTIRINKTYDQHNQIVTAPKTKNSYRIVKIPEDCMRSLDKWIKEKKEYTSSQFLFGFDKPLSKNTIKRRKDKWCNIANVKVIRIHDFRHSHVSLLINLGFSPFMIAKRLGHTPEMVNNVYGHMFVNAQDEMIATINKLKRN